MTAQNLDLIKDIKTPENGGGIMAFLLRNRTVNALLSFGLARAFGRRKGAVRIPFTKTLLAIKHCDVTDVFNRDTDFLIAPTNSRRFAEVDNPFILAMDRGPELSSEHRAMYCAFARVDCKTLMHCAESDAETILQGQTRIDAVSDYVWTICTRNAQRLFGLNHANPIILRECSRSLFAHIFFNANNDPEITKRAQSAAVLVGEWFREEIIHRHNTGILGDDFMGQMMRDPHNNHDMIKRCLLATLVGSIDTVTSSTAKILNVIDERPDLRRRMLISIDDQQMLSNYCKEALRFWPHSPFLARQVAGDTNIGKVAARAGEKVIVMTAAAMFDPAQFPEPKCIRTDRLNTSYFHFGHGIHECTGRAISHQLIPILIRSLLKRDYKITSDMHWAGPFPTRLPIYLNGGMK